ncbi:MAG: hypothetical protein EA001_06265 [Oscillatoriales cyanobacterium]|nr:MAG: hypothetical protein EA001_06265 [Oscillatoriales cyanobacterium]
MPAPYSLDLRQKVLQAIESGMSKSEASRVFHLSRNTIDLWFKQRDRTGSLAPKTGYHAGHRAKITDLERFAAFVKAHPDYTQAELAQAWGDGVSPGVIARTIAKLKLTRKKRSIATTKRS